MIVRLPSLHPAQREVMEHPARFQVLACGRRWGKTRLGALLCLATALSGRYAWWVAPSYKTAKIGWRLLKLLAGQIPGSEARATELRFTFPGGGWLQVRSADDPDSLRGEGLHFLVIDECAYVLERAWTEVLRATLSDYLGRALFVSAPRGTDWFWRLWVRGQGDDAEWKSWRFPSSSNPYLAGSEIEQARRDLPERTFAQEYEAAFLEDAGGVFRNVLGAVDKGRTENSPPEVGEEYTLGVDLARVEDFTVLSVLDSGLRQVYFDRFNEVSWKRQRAQVVHVAELYNGAHVVVDSTGVGDPIVEELEGALPECSVDGHRFTNPNKNQLADGLAISIETGAIRLMDVFAQTSELQAYQYLYSRARNRLLGALSGMHDDTVAALMLAHEGVGSARVLEMS